MDIKKLRILAEQGDADSQYLLAQEFRGQNLATYRVWLRNAAEQGHMEACFEYGNLSEEEDDDYEFIEPWFRRAAEQGHAQACMVVLPENLYHTKSSRQPFIMVM